MFTKKDGVQHGSGICDQDIRKFESDFGFRLPDDYRHFLLACNGAFFSTAPLYVFPIRERWESEFSKNSDLYPRFTWPPEGDVLGDLVAPPISLFGIDNPHEMRCLSPTKEWYGFDDRKPSGFLAIGITTSRDLICIACDGELSDQVFVWNSLFGAPDYGRADLADGLLEIASSFLTFWQDLVSIAEENLIV